MLLGPPSLEAVEQLNLAKSAKLQHIHGMFFLIYFGTSQIVVVVVVVVVVLVDNINYSFLHIHV